MQYQWIPKQSYSNGTVQGPETPNKTRVVHVTWVLWINRLVVSDSCKKATAWKAPQLEQMQKDSGHQRTVSLVDHLGSNIYLQTIFSHEGNTQS